MFFSNDFIEFKSENSLLSNDLFLLRIEDYLG